MLTILFIAFIYLAIGAVAGILAGLLGIGGGIITVPSLLLVFHFLDYPQAYLMHMAIGTSLAAMVFNTLSSTWAHHKKGAVLWKIVQKMSLGIFVGALIGAICADYLSSVILEMVFGLFLIISGFYFTRAKREFGHFRLPNQGLFTVISAAIGGFSNILGIGGGVITVPVLTSFQIPSKKAIGTSAAVSLLISFIGAICYLFVGLREFPVSNAIGSYTIGFINLPAFALIGLATFIAAPYGAKLTHQLPDQILKRIFGIVMIIVGLSMLI